MAGNPNRRAGTIFFKVDGVLQEAKGEFTYHLGTPKRDDIVGADSVHGYKETPVAPYIEGAITDRLDLDVKSFAQLDGVTVTLELAVGKTIVLRDAWYSGEAQVKTGEAEIPIKFTGKSAEESR